MIKEVKENKSFLIPYTLFLIFSLVILIFISKEETHLKINAANSDFFDHFFKYITFLGDGKFIVPLCILLGFLQLRLFISGIFIYLGSGLIVQILKRFIFPDSLRPVGYFQDTIQLHLIDGVKQYTMHSFPSGHTTSAFGIFFFLALISRSASLKLLFFTLAILVGYSRMYLSLHFLPDVVVGSMIGVIFAYAGYELINKNNKKWMKSSYMHIIGEMSIKKSSFFNKRK